jgi:hypothetical protein
LKLRRRSMTAPKIVSKFSHPVHDFTREAKSQSFGSTCTLLSSSTLLECLARCISTNAPDDSIFAVHRCVNGTPLDERVNCGSCYWNSFIRYQLLNYSLTSKVSRSSMVRPETNTNHAPNKHEHPVSPSPSPSPSYHTQLPYQYAD